MTKCKCHKSKDCDKKECKALIKKLLPGYTELKAQSDISARFALYLDSASKAKSFGRDSDQSITNAALDALGSVLYPNFNYFVFDTVGYLITPTPNNVDGVKALYGYYANYIYNAFSLHYYNQVRVQLVPHSHPRKAIMIASGGEWGSQITDTTTTPYTTTEQQTVTSWCVEWIEVDGVWYIYNYVEYGDRLYRLYPGNNPLSPTPQTYSLFFQRLYPNAILENTIPPGMNSPALPVPICLPCTRNQADTATTTYPCSSESASSQAKVQVASSQDKVLKITANKSEWEPQLLKAYGLKRE